MPTVDVRYAGVVLMRGAAFTEANRAGGFLAADQPLPVGTPLEVVIDGATVPAKVARVVEGGDKPGMQLRFPDVAATAVLGLPAAEVAEVAQVPEPMEASPSGGHDDAQAEGSDGGGRSRRGRRKRQ